jgi:hypothetical protein
MGHFTINANPDEIESAGNGLVELGEHMLTRAGEVRSHIGNVGPAQWSGGARTAIEQEAQGLANQLQKFGPMFKTAGQALKTLAGQVRTAKDTTLANLNSRWDGAQTTYQSAVDKANTAYQNDVRDIDGNTDVEPQTRKMMRQDAVDSRNWATSEAYSARTGTETKLQGEFDDLVRELETNFKTASQALVDNCVVAVPDKTVADFVAGGGSGSMPSWTNQDGTPFPPELGAQKATKGDLQLLDRRDQVLDGEKVAKALDDWYANSDRQPPPALPPEVKALTEEHKNDPYFGQTVSTTLGPEKIVDIMQKAKYLSSENPNYPGRDTLEEKNRIAGIQDDIATTLAVSLAAGSRAPGGLPDYAKKIVDDDPRMAGYLFKYADRANVAFGGEFTHQAGVTLMGHETPDPAIWQQRYGNDFYTFGTDPNLDEDQDPMLWFLRAADNSVDSAQGVMGDRDLMQYLIADQPDWDGRDDQAGNILRVATIDAARLPVPDGSNPQDSQAWKAAQISSNALDIAGQGKKPHDGVREELGGIIALYMPDVDRAFKNPDPGGPGVYDHTKDGWQPGVPGAGWPQFGIKIDDDDLRDVLGDVASSDTAVKIIGESAATFNQTRLIQGAQGVDGWNGPNDSPFQIAAHESTQLQGFLVDSLAHGDISDAEDLEEKRKKVATAMLLPVSLASNLVPTGSEWAEPLVDATVGKLSDEVAENVFKGDSVKLAYEEANSNWDQSRQQLKMQVLIAAYHSGQLPPEVDWPEGKTPDQLSDEEKARLLQQAAGVQGPTGDAIREVENGQDNYQSKFTE